MRVDNRTRNRYEVAFNVERIKLATDPLTIGEVVFREFSPELAKDWDCAEFDGASRKLLQEELDNLTGRPVGVITVDAGSAEKAVERAQECFDRALNVLRVSISSCPHWLIDDRMLLQRRGRFHVVRRLGPEARPVRTGSDLGFRPLDADLSGELAKSTKNFMRQLSPLYDGTVQGDIRDSLLRSIEWIGTSITREIYDHKVVDLCTALEAVLTTVKDRQKGGAIALRSMLLSMALGDGFLHPSKLRPLYRLRNEVVHGSDLGICTEDDYRRLRDRAKDVVLNIIKLNSTQGPIASPCHLIKLLEAPERLEKAIGWLESRPDKDTKALTEYAKQRLEYAKRRHKKQS